MKFTSILFCIFIAIALQSQIKVDPKTDCKDAIVLCNKLPLEISFTDSIGSVVNEITKDDCLLEEYASSWFKWICDIPGTLTFIITPENANDDLDFMIFALDVNDENCSMKKTIRCMGSSCKGPTGLSETDIDTLENFNCDPGENGFLKSIEMQKGNSYAMVINNFSLSGFGYKISFAGQGTFLDQCTNAIRAENLEDVLLFPNPTNHGLKIEAKSKNIDFIIIYDTKGKLLWQGKHELTNLDFSQLPIGVYIVKIFIKNNTIITKKVVKI